MSGALPIAGANRRQQQRFRLLRLYKFSPAFVEVSSLENTQTHIRGVGHPAFDVYLLSRLRVNLCVCEGFVQRNVRVCARVYLHVSVSVRVCACLCLCVWQDCVPVCVCVCVCECLCGRIVFLSVSLFVFLYVSVSVRVCGRIVEDCCLSYVCARV